MKKQQNEIRFVQIVSTAGGSLYGLDKEGRIWIQYYESNFKYIGWGLVNMSVKKEDLINI